ncbi:hypothetical protein BSKO_13897 [Bryopsis sp. KO-2023]|nr:hypothetical protein BSKO_13897 [Bryopsis sp. KO-2023]
MRILFANSRTIPLPPFLLKSPVRLGRDPTRKLSVVCYHLPSGGGPQKRSPFVKPKDYDARDIVICPVCGGVKKMPCGDCKSTGRLGVGGYNRKNPVNLSKIIQSKWTALEKTFGWRHFRAMQKRKLGKENYVLMTATCDENTKFWLNTKNLKDRSRWASGWLQKRQLDVLQEGPECKACSGSGERECPYCS